MSKIKFEYEDLIVSVFYDKSEKTFEASCNFMRLKGYGPTITDAVDELDELVAVELSKLDDNASMDKPRFLGDGE